MIKPIGLINGHYECRSLKQSIPILTELLALEVKAEKAEEVTMKHPNTDWRLIVHEGGSEAPEKPRLNHYGVRVTTNEEVNNAREYLSARKEHLHLRVDKTQRRHEVYSVHFIEPGGCWWEIESYEDVVDRHLGRKASNPWTTPLPPEKSPGRGYTPQAMTHGTIGCDNLEASSRFYREVLGLDVVPPPYSDYPHRIKHPSNPWYVVVLEVPPERPRLLGRFQRYTIAVESASAVEEAYRWLKQSGSQLGVTELEEISEDSGRVSFLLSDVDRNWWEVASPLS